MYATVTKLETPLVPRLSPAPQPLLPPQHHSLHVSLTLALVTLIRVHKSGLKRPCLVSSCPGGRVHFTLAGGESHHLALLGTFPDLLLRDLPGQATQPKPALSSGSLSNLNPS